MAFLECLVGLGQVLELAVELALVFVQLLDILMESFYPVISGSHLGLKLFLLCCEVPAFLLLVGYHPRHILSKLALHFAESHLILGLHVTQHTLVHLHHLLQLMLYGVLLPLQEVQLSSKGHDL